MTSSAPARIASHPTSPAKETGRFPRVRPAGSGASTGALLFSLDRAAAVLRAWRRHGAQGTSFRMLRFDVSPDVPAELQGRRFAVVDGVVASDPGTRELRSLGPVLDTFGPAAVTLGPAVCCASRAGELDIADHAVAGSLDERCMNRLVASAGVDSYTTLRCVAVSAQDDGTFAVCAHGTVPEGDPMAAIILRGDIARVLAAVEVRRVR